MSRPRGRGDARPAGRRGAGRARARQAGSIALELALVAPALLAIIGLVFAYGQVSQANGLLESAARDAARTATQLRSRAEAEREITRIVREGVRSVPGCRDTVSATLEGAYVAGGYVTVKVTCSYPLSDVMFAGAPGRMNPRVEFTSALDPYKGITP